MKSPAPVLGCQTAHSVTGPPSLWRNNDSVTKVPRRCSEEPKCQGRGGMEESYETFEEELWPPRAEPPPQRPVRAIHRSEMYNSRTTKEVNPVPQQPNSDPKAFPRQPSVARTTSLHKAFSIQNLTQIETPWENVTLNRCLFVAITILVLTSGFQRMHETFRGHGSEEEEEDAALTMRRPGAMRRRGPQPEPETSIWEVMLSWLPDLDDEEEEEDDDDDKEMKRGKSKKGVTTRAPSGVRNRPLQDKKLLKQRQVKLEDKRAGKAREETKGKKKRVKKENPEEEEEQDEETVPKKPKSGEKEKKKTKKD